MRTLLCYRRDQNEIFRMECRFSSFFLHRGYMCRRLMCVAVIYSSSLDGCCADSNGFTSWYSLRKSSGGVFWFRSIAVLMTRFHFFTCNAKETGERKLFSCLLPGKWPREREKDRERVIPFRITEGYAFKLQSSLKNAQLFVTIKFVYLSVTLLIC